MRERRFLFVADVTRYRPVAAIGLAIFITLPSLYDLLRGQLTAVVGVERFAVAFCFSMLATGLLARVLLHYAHQPQAAEVEPADAEHETAVVGPNGGGR